MITDSALGVISLVDNRKYRIILIRVSYRLFSRYVCELCVNLYRLKHEPNDILLAVSRQSNNH